MSEEDYDAVVKNLMGIDGQYEGSASAYVKATAPRVWLDPYVTCYGRCDYAGDTYGSIHRAHSSRFVLVFDEDCVLCAGEVLEYVCINAMLPTCPKSTYDRAVVEDSNSMNKADRVNRNVSRRMVSASMERVTYTFARVRWFKYVGCVKASLYNVDDLKVSDVFQLAVDDIWCANADPRAVGVGLVPVQRIARKFVQSKYTWTNLRALSIEKNEADLFQACPIRRAYTSMAGI
jgi:hypothetical protein